MGGAPSHENPRHEPKFEALQRKPENGKSGQPCQLQELQKEMKRLQEQTQRVVEENRKIQEENRRIQEENRQQELRRMQEAMAQMQETQRMQEENRRMQEENQKIRDKMEREEEKRKLNEFARKVEEDAKRRVAGEVYLREQAERNLENGVPPVKYPSASDIKAVRDSLQYQEDNLHLAITGVSGSGKSSLVNALRGYSNKHPNAVRTGTSETTQQIGRHSDPTRFWMFWYDVPGAGTLKVPDWQYFNDQGLYTFDIIIIAIDIRFTKIDVELLFNCKRFGIPAFVVRSKANQHISNIMNDSYDEDEEEEEEDDSELRIRERYQVARDTFITDTRREFDSTFKDAGLPSQKVYIISKDSLLSCIKGSKAPVDIIDEVELMTDILHAANGIYQNRSQDG